jgi:hypothetical protein
MKKINLTLLIILSFSVFTVQLHAQIPNYVPSNGLVGWWPFNGNASDESGNGNNGTVNGAILTTDRFGVSGNAYYFSSIGCGTSIDVNVNTTSIQSGLTMSVWVMNVGTGCYGPRLLEFYGNDGPGQAQWATDYNQNLYGIGSITSTGFGCAVSIPMSPNNVWSHLVYTNDGTIGKFYKNGQLISTMGSTGNPILSSSGAFGRMNHPAYDAYNGKLDDIGIWNRALSSCEVADLYYAQFGSLNNSSSQNQSAIDSYTWPVTGLTYNQSGTYTSTIPNAAGCDSTITLNLTLSFTGISESEDVSTFRIYPNPTRDVVFIEFTAERTDDYVLMDASGRKVQTGTLNGKTTSISLKDLNTGTYMLQIGADTVPIRLVKE